MSADNVIWCALVMLALGLVLAGVITSSRNTAKEATPAAPPPPEVIRTDVLIGRMVCERKGPHGCVEWRIYRTLEH
jgi:hypothetical protein